MLALTLLSFAAAASALAVQVPEIKLPLPLGDITWTAPSEHGNVSFTGSHADIIEQIAALHPRWQSNETFYGELVNLTVPDLSSAAHGVEKRSNRVNQYCQQYGWNINGMALVSVSMSNLKWILQHYGLGRCTVGPKSCGRFSCSYDNSIVMCNDNPFQVSIDCPTLAQNAFFIIQNCMSDQTNAWLTEGQAFYINPSYNVLVKHTDAGKSC